MTFGRGGDWIAKKLGKETRRLVKNFDSRSKNFRRKELLTRDFRSDQVAALSLGKRQLSFLETVIKVVLRLYCKLFCEPHKVADLRRSVAIVIS